MEKNPLPDKKQPEVHLTPHELFNKHMADPHHQFTEEEIKNLETKPEADPEFEKKEKIKLDELTNEMGTHPLNPYEILDND